MIAVLFEVLPKAEGKAEYLALAAGLRKKLTDIPGFISIERFQSMTDRNKILSLSFWEDEASVAQWRKLEEHRGAQSKGRSKLFNDYRIRVGTITRDYSLSEREQTPEDSREAHQKT